MADALQLIAENKRTKAKSLDLGNCGLTEVPAEVGDLEWLESLDLAYNGRLTNLGPLAGLSALQTLDAWGTRVSDLAPLAKLRNLQVLSVAETEITDLAPLAGLSALQALAVFNTQVSDLTPLASLEALEILGAWETQVSDLAPLAKLPLQQLSVEDTKITDLAPLADLTALQMLYVHNTQISDVTPLARLSALQTLDFSLTQVTDLSPLTPLIRRGIPVKWNTHHMKGENGIYVGGCPLINPPPDIVKQGNEAILNHFAKRALGEPEMAHVLFMDIVAYSQLPMAKQQQTWSKLQDAVRSTVTFREQAKGKLICLPTGDGMALAFFGDPEAPVRCAVELGRILRQHSEIKLRMGIHTGPVYRVDDINANLNVSGGAINLAQRVMDCGDAGHILMSRAAADVLSQLGTWSKFLHDLGDVEVKHGVRLPIFNFYSGEFGNAELPSRCTNQPSAIVLPREIRIFLASSFEFADDRDDFELYFRQQNDQLRKKGIYLEIVRWENFLDAVSKTRKQDDYNKAIRECDIFVSLFFTRTGKYTEEEFDVALDEFQKKDRPLIFTFFKKGLVDIDSLREEDLKSLRAFQAKLKKLGHFPTVYTSNENLKLKFRDQLDKVLEQIHK